MRDDELLRNERVVEVVNAVLDKIRDEIEKGFCISVITNELRTPMEVKAEILQIIDKYKAESENKE